VDDIQELPPSNKYPFSRPMGKGTFILPFLLLNEYFRNKNEIINLNVNNNNTPYPNSDILKKISKLNIFDDKNLFYKVIGNNHKILIIGDKLAIQMMELESKVYFTRFKNIINSLKLFIRTLIK